MSFLKVEAVCIAVILFNLGAVLASNEDEAWAQFKQEHQKNYSSPEEEARRRQIFLENKDYIDSHNIKQTQSSFKQGINPLSDLTPEEINASRNGFRLKNVAVQPIDSLLETLLIALNDTFAGIDTHPRPWYDDMMGTRQHLDWRERGRVSKVKDQGSCGSCWAFATTGALESILASRENYTLLSEQNLVDCSGSYGNHGCGGGLMDAALRYVRDNGIMSSAAYPYVAKDQECKFNKDKSIMRVRGSARLPSGNESLLQRVLSMTGPLPIAIDASARSFHSYKSGVYDDRICKNSMRDLNHAVLLVGYGTDRRGGDYWIIKNSWGNKWGDKGYMKLARNHQNQCGVANYAVVPISSRQ